jgi:hypothetical protein
MRNSIKNFVFLILLSSSIFATAKLHNLEKPKQLIKMTMGKSKYAPGQDITKNCYLYDTYIIIEINDPAIMGATSLKVYPITNTKINFSSLCKMPTNKMYAYEMNVESSGFYGYYTGKYDNFVLVGSSDGFGAGSPFQIFSISKQGYKLILQDWLASKEPFRFVKARNGTIGINYWRVVDSDCSLLLGSGDVCWQRVLRDNKITQKLMRPKCAKEYKRDKSPIDNPTQFLLHVEIPDLNKPLIRNVVEKKTKCYPRP